MGRKSKIEIEKERKRNNSSVLLWDEPTADLIWDGYRWKVVPTGFFSLHLVTSKQESED